MTRILPWWLELALLPLRLLLALAVILGVALVWLAAVIADDVVKVIKLISGLTRDRRAL